jgi:hypothetical protein
MKPYADLPNAHDLAQLIDQYWQAADDDNWGLQARHLPP